MLHEIVHIGLTVSDFEKSRAFYGDILGLDCVGELHMQGPECDAIFAKTGSRCELAYYQDKNYPAAPAIELIHFMDFDVEKQQTSLQRTCVSEICFRVEDCWAEYKRLRDLGVVFLSEPQPFDFVDEGFTKSIACYCQDPDGIIIELYEVC